LSPALDRRPSCCGRLGFRFVRKIHDGEAPGPKPVNVGFLVFQAPLLEHAQMGIVVSG
jgi:hypothetical protein